MQEVKLKLLWKLSQFWPWFNISVYFGHFFSLPLDPQPSLLLVPCLTHTWPHSPWLLCLPLPNMLVPLVCRSVTFIHCLPVCLLYFLDTVFELHVQCVPIFSQFCFGQSCTVFGLCCYFFSGLCFWPLHRLVFSPVFLSSWTLSKPILLCLNKLLKLIQPICLGVCISILFSLCLVF